MSGAFEAVQISSDPPVPNPSPVTAWTTYDITFEEPIRMQSEVDASPTLEGHSLTATPSGDLYLFGGSGRTNDVYLLSAASLQGSFAHFSLVSTTGEAPSPRMNHQAVLFGSLLIIWGGQELRSSDMCDVDLHILNLGEVQCVRPTDPITDLCAPWVVTCVWATVKAFGPAPIPRSTHVMSIIGTEMYVHGGQSSPQGPRNLLDFWKFDLKTCRQLW